MGLGSMVGCEAKLGSTKQGEERLGIWVGFESMRKEIAGSFHSALSSHAEGDHLRSNSDAVMKDGLPPPGYQGAYSDPKRALNGSWSQPMARIAKLK